MNKDNYITLIYKKLKREINSEEQATLDNWVDKEKGNRLLQQQIERNWKLSKEVLPPISVDTKKDFQGFKQRMQQAKASNAPPKEAVIRPINRSRRWLSIAAAIAIPLAAALWLLMSDSTADIPMSITQTTTGETKEILLSDGSKITLNENSELSYPTTFAQTERRVELKGEAYFEIAPDATRPFEVTAAQTSITVLGTVFNVKNDVSENNIKVSVEEGKVQFSTKTGNQKVILTKGEVGLYTLSTQQISEGKVNHKNASAWKSKVLTYKNTPLKTVVADLEQLFNAKITIAKETMQNCRVSANFRKATPQTVLANIAKLYQMELKVLDSKTYELTNGICQ